MQKYTQKLNSLRYLLTYLKHETRQILANQKFRQKSESCKFFLIYLKPKVQYVYKTQMRSFKPIEIVKQDMNLRFKSIFKI